MLEALFQSNSKRWWNWICSRWKFSSFSDCNCKETYDNVNRIENEVNTLKSDLYKLETEDAPLKRKKKKLICFVYLILLSLNIIIMNKLIIIVLLIFIFFVSYLIHQNKESFQKTNSSH